MSVLPTGDRDRKMLPMFKMITRYFPKALREVTRVCVANNVRFSPERAPEDIQWARGKSPDQLGSAFRHMLEYEVDGKLYEHTPKAVAESTGIERCYVLAEAAWRLLAALELQIEHCEMAGEPGVSETVKPFITGALGPVADRSPFPVHSDKVLSDGCWSVGCEQRRDKGSLFCAEHDVE